MDSARAETPLRDAESIASLTECIRHRHATVFLPDLTVDQRLHPALLLPGCTELIQDLGVAGVRRGASEGTRRIRAAAEYLVDVCVRQEALARAARFRSDEQRPHAHRFDLRLQVL